LALGIENVVKLWQIPENATRLLPQGHTGDVFCIAFCPDGKWLASGSQDKTVRLWQMPGGQAGLVLKGHNNHVVSIAFSPNGEWLVSSSEDKTVRLWELQEGCCIKIIYLWYSISSLTVAHQSPYRIAVSGANGNLVLIELVDDYAWRVKWSRLPCTQLILDDA